MKVTIIGGGGRVGSNAAFALQCAGIIPEIQILDANTELAEGEALDLLHGAATLGDQRIYAGDYDRAKDSDIFIITAGLRRKPDESRLELINRNVGLFGSILGSIESAGYRSDAQFFIVSNPVDILTRLAAEQLNVRKEQVYGLGTMLDTARFRSLIGVELGLPTTQVKAMILGEHGDSMLPVWSSATVAGMPLTGLKACTPSFQTKIFERAKGSGAEVIRRKGGAGWAVGATIAETVHSVALDKRQILPVSAVQSGAYGLKETSLSVPTVLGRSGIGGFVEFELWPKEMQALKASARSLDEIFAKVRG